MDSKENLTDFGRKHLLDQLFLAMIRFDRGDPMRIQHFTKVHSYAALIADAEGMNPEEKFTLEAAAYVHDIGIHVAEEKYGYQNGKLQEQEGPAAARSLMEPLGFPESVISRVEFLVGHHHTYSDIDGLDYRILVEADFIVNLYEDGKKPETILNVRKNIFRTKTGIAILNDMFGLERESYSFGRTESAPDQKMNDTTIRKREWDRMIGQKLYNPYKVGDPLIVPDTNV